MNKRNYGVVGNFGGKLLVRVLYSNHNVFAKARYYLTNNNITFAFKVTHPNKVEVEYACTHEQMLFLTSFAIEGRISKLQKLADARRNGMFQPEIPF